MPTPTTVGRIMIKTFSSYVLFYFLEVTTTEVTTSATPTAEGTTTPFSPTEVTTVIKTTTPEATTIQTTVILTTTG